MTSSESPKNILGALEIDGAVIIDSLIPESTTSKIASELRPYLDACPQGDNNFGTFTKRVGALMARSDTCRDLALHPLINDLCSKYLKNSVTDTNFISHKQLKFHLLKASSRYIGDRGVWGGYVNRKIETQFSTIWAVTNFYKKETVPLL